MADSTESIFTGANAAFIAELYDRYLEDPNSVDQSWAAVFTDLADDKISIQGEINGASWARSNTSVIGAIDPEETPKKSNGAAPAASAAQVNEIAQRSIRARILIRSYRVRGHLHAQFDPLGLVGAGYHRELDYKT